MWEIIRHQVAIAGKVLDKASGRGLGQMRVTLVDGPDAFRDLLALQSQIYGTAWDHAKNRPDRVITGPCGHFHFMDLPDGAYTVEAELPGGGSRYGKAGGVYHVTRTPEGNIVLAAADILLPPSTIKGRVVRQGTATPVILAEIRVSGSLEHAHSNESGDYVLKGIEASPSSHRALTVSARGYQDRLLTVLLPSPGDEVVLDVQLLPA